MLDCMAHIRRYFEQALAENRQMAEHALKEIQLLYRIEHDCDQMQLTENERMGKRRENLPLHYGCLEAMDGNRRDKIQPKQPDREGDNLRLYPLGEHDEVSAGRTYPY